EVEQGEAHESASVYPRVFPASEAALDADAEVVQADKTGRVAGQCFGAYGPVVREPVAAKHRILTRVVLGFPAAAIRHAETAPVTEGIGELHARTGRKADGFAPAVGREPDPVGIDRQPTPCQSRIKTRLAALRDAQPRLCVSRNRCAQRNAESEGQNGEALLLHLRNLRSANLLRATWFVEAVCIVLRR